MVLWLFSQKFILLALSHTSETAQQICPVIFITITKFWPRIHSNSSFNFVSYSSFLPSEPDDFMAPGRRDENAVWMQPWIVNDAWQKTEHLRFAWAFLIPKPYSSTCLPFGGIRSKPAKSDQDGWNWKWSAKKSDFFLYFRKLLSIFISLI